MQCYLTSSLWDSQENQDTGSTDFLGESFLLNSLHEVGNYQIKSVYSDCDYNIPPSCDTGLRNLFGFTGLEQEL